PKITSQNQTNGYELTAKFIEFFNNIRPLTVNSKQSFLVKRKIYGQHRELSAQRQQVHSYVYSKL
ncbi:hypothetical protein, partial [uncultured Ruegeria sp.]|uniref:hypothetical protein n=1 Tax=uncultured Ruegeria sp. TaxID=259304 RepID=UPI0026104FD4